MVNNYIPKELQWKLEGFSSPRPPASYAYDMVYIYYIWWVIFYFVYLGESPMVWKNLKKGKHTVIVRARCLDNMSSVTKKRKFQFRIR